MEFRFALPTLLFLVLAFDVTTRDALATWLERPTRRSLLAVPIAVAWALLVLDVRPLAHKEARGTCLPKRASTVSRRCRRCGSTMRCSRSARCSAGNWRGLAAAAFATCCIGMVGYFGEISMSDAYGLINPRVVHRPIAHHDRPGHEEKRATLDELLDDGATLADWPAWNSFEGPTTRVTVGGREFWLMRHQPALEQLAHERGWHYPNVRAEVTHWLGTGARESSTPDRSSAISSTGNPSLRVEVAGMFDAELQARAVRRQIGRTE